MSEGVAALLFTFSLFLILIIKVRLGGGEIGFCSEVNQSNPYPPPPRCQVFLAKLVERRNPLAPRPSSDLADTQILLTS